MILVTGATGNIGSALLRQLSKSDAGPVRGLTRDVRRASFPDGVEAVEGDLTQVESLKPALDGVRSLLLLAGTGADADVLAAARQSGVEHVVLVSSITVQTHPHLAPAEDNRVVEESVKGSGMAWTSCGRPSSPRTPCCGRRPFVTMAPSGCPIRTSGCRPSTPRTSRRWPGWR